MKYMASPDDSRYIPLTQQPACCVPTCLQMVMYRNDIPLMPAEELGYHLGLTVHPNRAPVFHNVRTSETSPPAGYGTQIYNPEFEPNKVFMELNIPLTFEILPINSLVSPAELLNTLEKAETSETDALLCFHHGTLIDSSEKDWGHVCVFDRVVDGKIRIIDPSPDQPKWRLVEAEKLYAAMKKHGARNTAGLWLLRKK